MTCCPWPLISRARRQRGEPTPLLAGKALAVYLEKPSLRTRASFEIGMTQLGGAVTTLRTEEVGLGTRESAADVGKVLSRYYDVVVMRTFAPRRRGGRGTARQRAGRQRP